MKATHRNTVRDQDFESHKKNAWVPVGLVVVMSLGWLLSPPILSYACSLRWPDNKKPWETSWT